MGGRLTGRVALISGAASGMGAAHARAFVAEGAAVMIGDISDAAGALLAEQLGERAGFTHLDVTRGSDWEAAVAATVARFGKLNVLVNNAGILDGGPIGTYTEKQWQNVLSINLTGPFLGLTAARDALVAGRPAAVVNISSAAGIQGVPGAHAYTASKFGLRGLTKSAALELAPLGVRVNSVHPGGILTPMLGADENATLDRGQNPLARLGLPEEVTPLVVFLASEESSYCNGAEFVVDGGMTAGRA
ncbi:SDR family oxidoreductase [Nocardia sp. SYP-A9097]|uniref:SDR family oxidoreductase n=1 Tax=Nocardia sp. SYP-A9097 TaxID=2663237 RepID=UPI00129B5E27|nr:SDR family oxidoreductase [Nocardia sp. SYP-A9097]MRH91550.1 SDR family oxidoreductase [Nocardia sp. SYP-A9097]